MRPRPSSASRSPVRKGAAKPARIQRPAPYRQAAVAAASAVVAFLATTTEIAQQDVASLLLRSLDPATRWAMALSGGPGGETRIAAEALGEIGGSATLPAATGAVIVEGADPMVTGSLDDTPFSPDEERVDRSWKSDLPMTVTTPATAPGFSAGSILQEQSRLTPPDGEALPAVAFSRSSLPLSALAVARFISPRQPVSAFASLEPAPKPVARPDTTLLVAASYPLRDLSPAVANEAAEAMLAAYAPDASVVDQDMFSALFTVPKDKPPVPVREARAGEHWWARLLLPSGIYSAAEQQCLAEAVYFEARGEPYRGQVAVAQVVLNRVRNPAYPDTVCGVVYQNKTMTNACQFSFACDGIKDVVQRGAAWTIARKVANDVSFQGVWLDDVGTSTHYHATYVRPNWAGVFRKSAKIGRHVFYNTIYGGWS